MKEKLDYIFTILLFDNRFKPFGYCKKQRNLKSKGKDMQKKERAEAKEIILSRFVKVYWLGPILDKIYLPLQGLGALRVKYLEIVCWEISKALAASLIDS